MSNDPKRCEYARELRTLSQNRIYIPTDFSQRALGVRCVFASLSCLFVCTVLSHAQDAPYNSATISGLGARNIGSATMSGRISAIAGTREPSGKITLFVGAASGGVW